MSKIKTLHASPADAESAFYDALEHGDLNALMDLWSEDDEIVCIHPGAPRAVGHSAVRATWKAMLANGPIHARPTQVAAFQGPMSAAHCLIEQVIVTNQRGTAVINVYATNVYVKGPLGWRMVLHHASLAPGDQAAVSAMTAQILH